MTDSMRGPAPFDLYRDTVRANWIDYNGHLMDGYYLVYISFANEPVFEYFGFTADYRAQTGCTTYTVESHLNFLRELKAGAPLRFTTQILDHDSKRIQVFTRMYHAAENYLAATGELMYLHVNQTTQKVAPMPAPILDRVRAAAAAHAALPRPPQAGRSIGIPRPRQ